MKEHIINLDLPAHQRWEFLIDYKIELNELLECYLKDFQGSDFIIDNIKAYKTTIISKEYLEEIAFIASISNFSADEVLIANLYYDLLKMYLGCTAFAIETNGKIIHSRNLDWWTENNLLSNYSTIFDFQRNGKTTFKTIGWFGFIGALSGIKPQGFSLTLNAVLSNDSPEIAPPVTFLLRDILDSAKNFEEAKEKLETTKIASDCLLLLSGINTQEMVVIERTPTRFATRKAENNLIVVTNDYKKLDNHLTEDSILQSTSCSRYERTNELLTNKNPTKIEDCFNILKDENIMMSITVQQMVFDNTSGIIQLIKT